MHEIREDMITADIQMDKQNVKSNGVGVNSKRTRKWRADKNNYIFMKDHFY